MEWGPVTANRRRQWAAIARRHTAQALRAYKPAKRYTLLLAFLVVRGEEVTDAIVEMFDTLIGRVFNQARMSSRRSSSTRHTRDWRAPRLFRAVAEGTARSRHSRLRQCATRSSGRVPRERVRAAVERDTAFEQGEAQRAYLAQVDRHFRHLRSFAPLVVERAPLRLDAGQERVARGAGDAGGHERGPATVRAVDPHRSRSFPGVGACHCATGRGGPPWLGSDTPPSDAGRVACRRPHRRGQPALHPVGHRPVCACGVGGAPRTWLEERGRP